MIYLDQFADFHFIRPEWLLLILPSLMFFWFILSHQNRKKRWHKMISSHLLQYLLVGTGNRRGLKPINLWLPVMFLAILALAGPTWQKETTPFTEDQAPLAIALDLSVTMNAIDIQPSRLERAKQKILDLLAERKGARTALLVYAGSAHMVLPLTDDSSILEMYLASLSTDILPSKGKNPDQALQLAIEMLSKETTSGTILFITDGIGRDQFPAFLKFQAENRGQILVLAIGTEQGGPIQTGENNFLYDEEGNRVKSSLNREELDQFSRETGAYITMVTVDKKDVNLINRHIKSHLTAARENDESSRWKDSGYYLLFPLAFMALFWYRRGWTVKLLAIFLLTGFLFQPLTVHAEKISLKKIFLTPDQQGRYYFERGDYAKACECFQDPLWKGISCYISKDYEKAVQQFSRLDTAESFFNLGNAYSRLGQFENSITSYQQALKRQSGYLNAQHNLELITSILKQKKKNEKEEENQPGSMLDPDEIKISDPNEKKKRSETEGDPEEIKMDMLTDEQLNEMWMRRLQTSPADFLRLKFKYQLYQHEKKLSDNKKPE